MSNVSVHKRSTWQIWRDVVFALFTREIRTGFNDRFGLSWAIINPVVFIAGLSFVREVINGPLTHTLPTFTFMVIGVLYIQSFLRTMNGCAIAIRKNKALYAFRQVQPISSVLAAGLFELLVKIVSLICILVIMYFLDIEVSINSGFLFIGSFLLLVVLAVAIGLISGIAELYVAEISKLREMFSRPLFFISGTFFSLQDIPQEFWVYFTWNPILHAIELSRFASQNSYGSAGVSFGFLSIVVLSTVFFALAFYFVSWKQAISR